MIYPYLCPSFDCNYDFEVIKAVSEMQNEECCPKCGTIAHRYIARTHFFGASDWDNAHYNQALGKVMKSNKQADREARARGWVDVGTEQLDRTSQRNAQRRHETEEEASKPAMDALEYGLKKEMGKI